LPDDPRHLVAVHLDDRVLDLDLAHGGAPVLASWKMDRAERGDGAP
jgi:hypothetical protein